MTADTQNYPNPGCTKKCFRTAYQLKHIVDQWDIIQDKN